MNKTQLLNVFKDMLPASLGTPYFVNTAQQPYVFVAFYASQRHELADGRVVNGNEFRLWKPSAGFRQSAPLAGIFGIDPSTCDLVLCGLVDQGTRRCDLKPYGSMIREMMHEIVADNVASW